MRCREGGDWIDPVTCSPAAGVWVGLLLWLFLVAAGLCRRAGGVKLERPPRRAWQAWARTNELDAGERRPVIRSEEQFPLRVGV
jgi:hypothetical protein